MSGIEPCPFCGKETAPDHISYDNCFVVRCLYCGYVSCHTASERGAIQNHNSLCRMFKAVGNSAAMREALVEARKVIKAMGGYWAIETLPIIDAALALPPRNCDVGTAKERMCRYNRVRDEINERYERLGEIPSSFAFPTAFEWEDGPYEDERGAEK